jgi:hypothetical protein
MALNIADRIKVRENLVPRCTGVVVNLANYILGNVNATEEQRAWARPAIRNPASQGEQVSWYILNDPTFIDNGSSISDSHLTGITEAAINNHFIAPAPE